MAPGSTFYLQRDEHGEWYDVLNEAGRQRCRERLETERQWLVVGSLPCTWWSQPMALRIPKMSEPERARHDIEAVVLLSLRV